MDKRIMEQSQKPIVVGTTGASGMPVLLQCLSLIHKAQRRAVLVLTNGAMLTMRQEMGLEAEQLAVYADAVYAPENIVCAASGSWPAAGMLIVPCSMKTVAGIHSGYSDNLLLRAADDDTEGTPPACIGGQGNAAEPHTPEKYV